MRGHWIDDWRPEDESFWRSTGKKIANRNLWFSVFSEHIGFSIWTLFSVLVLFMGPAYNIDAAGKFLLVSVATLVGAALRLPYSLAVAVVGGRNWTIVSAGLLLVPTVLLAVFMEPGTSFTTFVVLSALVGVGGGNFASSMTNINAFFPDRYKGAALGINAGGGNLGVAVIQLVGLLIIATAGPGSPRILLAVYIPLIVLSLLGAALFMDNISSVRNDAGALKEAARDAQTWVMSFLYIGTFGSFIGYSFAFGLVLQNQFGRTPLQAAAVTFIGPLLGSLIRPVGGWLSDRVGGVKVTFWNFAGMAVATLVCIGASAIDSLALFTAGFVLLFITSGIGNGSTYKMIPSIFRTKALAAQAERGWGRDEALLWARRISGAAIGITAAVGAFGGLLINLAFRSSFQATGSGAPAFWAFLAFYAACMAVTAGVYMRRTKAPTDPATGTRLSYAEV
ncbi:NNP family nitrate/nitrite transporter-like MFS transporter [Actinomycetospora succinea]|uniref:NNP family nitrate/nitrite transporter-like MFS transporter n=1 Tax=Actinomycetospora succinea TaxID=663603 RepID=A0A4R6VA54_9PSEU|nr:nitrate/nitrite transporter [Actinomycetospora succinea]TDQ58515.1 NNP family nitrate/nitrite transporter-like MFS transporter [Actinomycetospora succinea]